MASNLQILKYEYVDSNRTREKQEIEFIFDRAATLELLALYKKYRNTVGTAGIRNIKKMWEVIANEMKMSGFYCSSGKCENRWKVLERSYKKIIDNNHKSSRVRKCFEFEKELEDIYSAVVNIRPKSLSSDSERMPQISEEHVQENTSSIEVEVPVFNITEMAAQMQQRKRTKKRLRTSMYVKRNEILTEMKNDIKQFYEMKIKIEQEKLEISKQKQQDREKRTALLKDYVQQINLGNKGSNSADVLPPQTFLSD